MTTTPCYLRVVSAHRSHRDLLRDVAALDLVDAVADVDVTLPTERLYVAVGASRHGGAWGIGLSADEAMRGAKKFGARARSIDVWRLPEGAHSARVGDLGDIHWRFHVGADQNASAEQVVKGGKEVA